MKTRSLPSATLSLFLSSVAVWLVGFSAGVMAHPTELALRYPDESESAVLPCLNLKNMSSFFYVNPCPGDPQEWLSKNELHCEVALDIHVHKVGKDDRVSDSH